MFGEFLTPRYCRTTGLCAALEYLTYVGGARLLLYQTEILNVYNLLHMVWTYNDFSQPL